jgi:hypothetical protein
MKYIILFTFIYLGIQSSNAQGLKNLIKKATSLDSNIQQVTKGTNLLQQNDIAAGLKEALQIGTEKSVKNLSSLDGFFGNAALKILMPPEADKIETSLRKLGLNKQVDEAILSMNRAAEDACKSASPVFIDAIKHISFNDAIGILKGNDDAATSYLKNKTSIELTNQFKPTIEGSLQKVGATKNWNTLVTQYNRFALKKINPDLTAYVTERALMGIFSQIAFEEKNIRKDPLARSSELLKKVFGTSK